LELVRSAVSVGIVIIPVRISAAAVLGRLVVLAVIIAAFRFLICFMLRLSLWIFFCSSAGFRTGGSCRRRLPTLPLHLGRPGLRRHGCGGLAARLSSVRFSGSQHWS
jgi:hypothetical protein